jgi:glutamate--cysteine ligase
VKDQKAIEAADTMPFEQYRQQYISPERLGMTRAAIAPALAAV